MTSHGTDGRARAARIGLGLGVALLAMGCGSGGSGDGDDSSIASGPLSGMIDGQAWTAGTGESNAFLSDGTMFFVDLYSQTFTACAGAAPSAAGNRMILNVPKMAGTYALSLDFNQTFYIDASQANLAATRGHMVVDSVTDTTITGGAVITYDAQNTVNGHFQFGVCP